MNRNSFITIFLLLISVNCSHAFDLDMTVDDDIRKNYNSSKLIKDTHTEDANESLPALPEITKYNQPEPVGENVSKEVNPPVQVIKTGNIKISGGTSFNVVSSTKINDWLAKGNTVKFYTKSPIIKRKYTIPTNTVFTGEIVETHQPQITCNGGLVVIRVRSMRYNGQTIPINAYITRAEEKMVFFNKIKGKRTYMRTMWIKGNWGRTLFGRMLNLTVNLGGEGSTILLSPFPFAYGTICLGLNTLASPITAFFSKGGHVSIPAGSAFRIKLMDDVYID